MQSSNGGKKKTETFSIVEFDGTNDEYGLNDPYAELSPEDTFLKYIVIANQHKKVVAKILLYLHSTDETVYYDFKLTVDPKYQGLGFAKELISLYIISGEDYKFDFYGAKPIEPAVEFILEDKDNFDFQFTPYVDKVLIEDELPENITIGEHIAANNLEKYTDWKYVHEEQNGITHFLPKSESAEALKRAKEFSNKFMEQHTAATKKPPPVRNRRLVSRSQNRSRPAK